MRMRIAGRLMSNAQSERPMARKRPATEATSMRWRSFAAFVVLGAGLLAELLLLAGAIILVVGTLFGPLGP